jgi:hypothetical protein
MRTLLRICFCLIYFFTSKYTFAQSFYFKPSFRVIFDSAKGSDLIHQCSRDTPHRIESYWVLSEKDVSILEKNFKKIYKFPSKECSNWPGFVNRLENFAFQYLGVIVSGQRFIYINAFPVKDSLLFKKNNLNPATYPRNVCDGGKYFFGALFDIKNKQFNFLAFNASG